MGQCTKGSNNEEVARKKRDPKTMSNGAGVSTGAVQHREAKVNRVDESEMQIAEIKSRLNKLQQYRKKIENQVSENN